MNIEMYDEVQRTGIDAQDVYTWLWMPSDGKEPDSTERDDDGQADMGQSILKDTGVPQTRAFVSAKKFLAQILVVVACIRTRVLRNEVDTHRHPPPNTHTHIHPHQRPPQQQRGLQRHPSVLPFAVSCFLHFHCCVACSVV